MMTVKWNNALYVLENIARRYARTKWQNVFAMNGIFNPIWPGRADLPPSFFIKVKYYRFNAVEFFIADFSNLFSVPDFSIQGTSHIDQLSWALFDSFSFAQSEIKIYKVYGIYAATYQLKYWEFKSLTTFSKYPLVRKRRGGLVGNPEAFDIT